MKITSWLRSLFQTTALPVVPPPADEPRGKPMTISAQALAHAKANKRRKNRHDIPNEQVMKPYQFPAGVLPEGVAMDSCGPASGVGSWASNGISMYNEGLGFFGYPYLAQLNQRAEYRHACEIWAEHAVRKWIKITGVTDDTKKSAIEAELDRLNVRDVFQDWMTQDQMYGRGQIFLDFGDADRSNELKVPLRVTPAKINQRRPLRALSVVEPMWSSPGMYVTNNPLRPDFYKPQAWFVYGKTVHTSRMLTIVSRPVSDMLKPAYAFGGVSLTQMMAPYVDNWLTTRESTSDMINTYSTMVLSTDMGNALTGGNGQNVYDRVDMFNQTRDNRGTMVVDGDSETLTNVAVPLSGLPELQSQTQEHLASVARIPLSIYLQITPTGLNATSDGETRNFYADVHGYQEKNVRPAMHIVLQIVQLGLFGAIDPAIGFEFIPLWELSEKEQAETRKIEADTDAVYITNGVVSNDEARERLANEEDGPYKSVDLSGPAPEPEVDETTKTDNAPAMDEWIEANHPRDDLGRFGFTGATKAFADSPTVWTSKASGIEYVSNAVPQVPRSERAAVWVQQEALEDAMVEEDGRFFETRNVNPTSLKSLQNQVARNQVLSVTKGATFNSEENGEAPLVIDGPDGLILIDGNHRANAALLAGGTLRAQVFDYGKWKEAQEAKKPPKASTKEEDDALLKELLG